ncbi:ATP-dependent metallopeptidase FtsH/Yme1/Tma family protein [Jiangella aurantiaca]|uniref:ATP-dependent zinc metalloprotease FtsH n=1 Tax=Jiangella aurantiaca TaxID=2530373 RepID=A0A4R5A624_9ACTN|nr:ATP-dependent zinc metalloprotease FtsH [Jiangella aurantiaca]TDD67498.1 ATP-dependent metallopeptidase FtsH/Yme1/Tma family protein [Jiangella aurantiaca]
MPELDTVPFRRPPDEPARPAGSQEGERPPSTPPKPKWRIWPFVVSLLVFAVLFFGPGLVAAARTEELSYSAFLSDVSAGKVSSVAVGSEGELTGTLSDGTQFTAQAPTWALTTQDLSSRLEKADVKVTAYQQTDTLRQLVASLLPAALLVGGFVWLSRRAQQSLAGGGGLGGLGGLFRTRARVTDAERPTTRFVDVAGYEGVKEEVREVVDFLQNPDRYRRAGARGPRGVLLVGPPGTGKTLLARAVAGESKVPFYAVTGSSFVEMFVGLGASRVRELFAEARRNGPAIVFIDEIDALGARRGTGAIAGHDEREQTLNQLLAEMDGFTEDSSVVVLANTNRPEVLDPALLRPGRFDRQIQVPLPALADRERILAVHVLGKRLDATVDLHAIARGTPGFSGADLANLVNEAALRAARDHRDELRPVDFDDAKDRLILGRRDGTALLPEERQRVAVHEAGHALVAGLSETADPVAKVTILPAGMALGATHQLPLDERRLYTEQYLHESLAVRLAGRAAELIVFGQPSTGAVDDLASATQLALRMVREYGLSRGMGPVAYPAHDDTYPGQADRPYGEETQRLVDGEVARLLREAEEQADRLLRGHRAALDRLSRRLLDTETVDGSVVYEIIRAA